MLALILTGSRERIEKSSVILVFGNKVEEDGKPSERLARRLDRACDLFKAGFAPEIFVSGGLGSEGFNEAEVMRDYLVLRKIPPEKIITDNNGLDTWKSVLNFQKAAKIKKYQSVIVVSDFFHLPRIQLAMERIGQKNVSSAGAYWKFRWKEGYFMFREFFAIYSYLLFKKL